ncbi:bis(5'-nucleosyl)-tetraphosphatase (symmetrical) YqeK [Proteiniclasticum sp. SCR006]|uniref:bis(5'-nucleosyl)-tetraphosphatase (symmetrical) n=1 Tax=Proteiniclasticum aestuarii TaxID=2817862 RepID=A0A939HEE1_9CLOT|nr:bis(5'-nucleosyl)-tetraphosphatase (symmetrical) YqeK [Proteiniclasticum aestuarii]MBO1265778.1 bis(5'-nucleosyl)-tetraphosphatase (symmetrical) YqeK [Proteiniclasticum aestuarii]
MSMNYTVGKPWSKKDLLDYLNHHLKESRVRHILGVAQAAKELSKLYGIDPDKVERAALYHDILKDKDKIWLVSYMRQHGEEPGEGLLAWKTLHAPAGSIFAKEVGGERDEETLNAIRYHTTGRPGMSLAEKIIFVSDYIEEGRDFDGVEQLRTLARKDLDQAVLASLLSSISYLKKRNDHVMTQSLEAVAYYTEVTERKDAK